MLWDAHLMDTKEKALMLFTSSKYCAMLTHLHSCCSEDQIKQRDATAF